MFLSQLTTFPTVLFNSTLRFRRQSAVIQMMKPQFEARHANASSWFGFVRLLESESGSFHCDKIRANNRLIGGYEIHCLLYGKSDDPSSFSRKPFSCSALGKPQAMSQAMTRPEIVDWIWSPYASKELKSGCVLDGHLTLEHVSNYERQCTRVKRNLLAGMLYLQTAEEKLLQVVCETIKSLSAENCRKCTMQ